ncbi:unnamed protein product [Amoebophrya sp. A120]|nr:unnamed protein product [Amoebophrya sp. A120]|eukprot:GSA120T00020741001.1
MSCTRSKKQNHEAPKMKMNTTINHDPRGRRGPLLRRHICQLPNMRVHNSPSPSFAGQEQQYKHQHTWSLCMTSSRAECSTVWAPSEICHANSFTRHQMTWGLCVTSEGEGDFGLCATVILNTYPRKKIMFRRRTEKKK